MRSQPQPSINTTNKGSPARRDFTPYPRIKSSLRILFPLGGALIVFCAIIVAITITTTPHSPKVNTSKDSTQFLRIAARTSPAASDGSIDELDDIGNKFSNKQNPTFIEKRSRSLDKARSVRTITYQQETRVGSSLRQLIRKELQDTTTVKPVTNFVKGLGSNVWDMAKQIVDRSSTPIDSVNVEISYADKTKTDVITKHMSRVASVDTQAQKVYGWVRRSDMVAMAEEKGVVSIEDHLDPITRSGSVTTEGDILSQSNKVREAIAAGGYAQDGKGIKIGVISDGVDSLQASVNSQDLPGNVTVIKNYSGDEGTAMLEIIHDMVPGAELYFSTGFANPQAFKDSVDSLIAAGCKVIVDDIGYTTQPFFEEPVGSIAKHVSDAISNNNIIYVSSSGNAAENHYQGEYFQDTASPNLHDFSRGTSANRGLYFKGAGTTAQIILQWNDTWGRSANDYDLHIVTSDGSIAPGTETYGKNTQDGNDSPLETVKFLATSGVDYEIVVENVNGAAAPKILEIYTYYVSMYANNLVTDDSTFGHPAVVGAVGVAAISQADPGNDTVEYFSSRGPATMINPSQTRIKPDISGIDGVKITGAGGFGSQCGGGFCRFYGTSASAPYIAAIMAQYWAEFPGKTGNEVRDIIVSTAVDVEVSGKDTLSGSGRGNALNAFNATASRPKASPAGGTYATGTLITLTSRNATEIRYTTDGTTPTNTSPIYSSAIPLSNAVTLKARAFGTYDSDVMTETYTITGPPTSPTSSPSPMEILFPLYKYPAPVPESDYYWDDIAASNSKVAITTIINPASGPGNPGNPAIEYVNAMNQLKTAGVKMIGYIHTGRGTRDINVVKSEVDQWNTDFAQWITGIFVDEASNSPSDIPYYTTLYNYIKSKPLLTSVILNPGTNTDEGYMAISDKVIIYEDVSANWAGYTPNPYVTRYPNRRFAMIVHTEQTENGMKTAIDRARSLNIGNIYVTHDIMSNPFDTLPSYWTQEVEYLSSLNQPNPTTTLTATLTPTGVRENTPTITETSIPAKTNTPTLTPTSVPGECGAACQSADDCNQNLLCDADLCRVPACEGRDCTCAFPTATRIPTPTPIPSSTPIHRVDPTEQPKTSPTESPITCSIEDASPFYCTNHGSVFETVPHTVGNWNDCLTWCKTKLNSDHPLCQKNAGERNCWVHNPPSGGIKNCAWQYTEGDDLVYSAGCFAEADLVNPTIITPSLPVPPPSPSKTPPPSSTLAPSPTSTVTPTPTKIIAPFCDVRCGACGWRDTVGACHTDGVVGGTTPNTTTPTIGISGGATITRIPERVCCYHTCMNDQCVGISGYGNDSCTTNSQCVPPTQIPASNNIANLPKTGDGSISQGTPIPTPITYSGQPSVSNTTIYVTPTTAVPSPPVSGDARWALLLLIPLMIIVGGVVL